ncbi:MAG: EthD domain-containing protein [Marinobacter sp.]
MLFCSPGVAELWFDSVEDNNKFFSNPDYLRDIQPDERRFAEMENTRFFVTEEFNVII